MIAAWQDRWNNSTKDRTSWSYCDNVRHRLNNDWELNHYVVQFLTGHGNFNAKLYGFGLVDDPMWLTFGEHETSDHVLWACPHFNQERGVYLGLVGDPLDLRREMRMELNRRELFKLMTCIGKRKETEDRERRLNMEYEPNGATQLMNAISVHDTHMNMTNLDQKHNGRNRRSKNVQNQLERFGRTMKPVEKKRAR